MNILELNSFSIKNKNYLLASNAESVAKVSPKLIKKS